MKISACQKSMTRLSTAVMATSIIIVLSGCSTGEKKTDERAPANMGGANYNIGTYACSDSDSGLESTFTFGQRSATMTVKGEPVELECNPSSSSDGDSRSLFKNEFKQIVDICSGVSKKGRIVAGTSNSMGAVEMTAFLRDSAGTVKAKSILNCRPSKTKESGWE